MSVTDLFQTIGVQCTLHTVHGAVWKSRKINNFRSDLSNFFFSACSQAESLHLKRVARLLFQSKAALEDASSACELPQLLSLKSGAGNHSKGRDCHNEDVEVACEEYPDFCAASVI